MIWQESIRDCRELDIIPRCNGHCYLSPAGNSVTVFFVVHFISLPGRYTFILGYGSLIRRIEAVTVTGIAAPEVLRTLTLSNSSVSLHDDKTMAPFWLVMLRYRNATGVYPDGMLRSKVINCLDVPSSDSSLVSVS